MINRIIEAMDFESDTKNWKFPFERMCKFYGRDFIDTIRNMWQVNGDVQTPEEFCEMNNIPVKFFEKTIKINKEEKKIVIKEDDYKTSFNESNFEHEIKRWEHDYEKKEYIITHVEKNNNE